MSISEIRKRWEQQRDDCPRCGGDGCDPEEYMPNRSQLQMDPDPCMECLPTLLAERNQFSQDIKTLLDVIVRMGKGIKSVSGLIYESSGVTGLHRNGDVAEWGELRTGGRFEDWLREFDDAMEILKELEET